MLKQCIHIDELALIDTSSARGFGIELAHIDTKCKVHSYTSADGLSEALEVRMYSTLIPRRHHAK